MDLYHCILYEKILLKKLLNLFNYRDSIQKKQVYPCIIAGPAVGLIKVDR
jgi:hypothetical protein